MSENVIVEMTEEQNRRSTSRKRFFQVWTAVGAILLTGVFVYVLNILS
ncbi:MAG: hypothetical protein RR505_10625 [Raoultibacter sp.]